MKGSKPLSDSEIALILENLSNLRNQTLFVLGLRTGFRISELLSLTWAQVVQYNAIRDSITVARSSMKGKRDSRTVTLHPDAQKYLNLLLLEQPVYEADAKLFPISRMQAHRIIKRAVILARIKGKVSSHSMRKTLAMKVYEALDKDLVNTQRALGHKSISSTISYLSFDQEIVNNAIKGVK